MELTLKAYPKINIGLYVGKKNEDGYHLIVSIFQKVDNFFDTIKISYNSSCNSNIVVKGMEEIPLVDNTMYKAALEWMKLTGNKAEITIEIDKMIPSRAGLGGGSSDAGSVILGLERMTGNKLSIEELKKLALKVGSDVPFFVYDCDAALVTGRGENIKPICSANVEFDLIDSGFEKKSTKDAYNELDAIGVAKEQLPDADKLVQMYSSDCSEWKFENNFEKIYPELPDKYHLSGSGSWCWRIKC